MKVAPCATRHRSIGNNKLAPANAFTAPADALQKYDTLPVSVGTDPSLAVKTRRGTGYYKAWYRGMFGHSGWCATLEDWFDPHRTRDDYVPTGFKPYDAKTYAVKGHPFKMTSMKMGFGKASHRKALVFNGAASIFITVSYFLVVSGVLIAFLKTL